MYRSFRVASESLVDIQAIDFFFAKETMSIIQSQKQDISHQQQEVLFHLLVRLMSSYSKGNSCENILALSEKLVFSDDEKKGFKFPSSDQLIQLLKALDYKKLPIYFAEKFNSLYIKRLWLFENEVAEFLKQRIKLNENIDAEVIKSAVNSLFDRQTEQVDWQKIAVANSLIRNFSIISGGPGTGKTTTVTKLLLAEQILNQGSQKIALLAPTGKAAQRLTESIKSSIAKLRNINDVDQIIDDTLLEAQTIHRFLGLRPNSNYVKYDQGTLAPYDIIIVDEASMVDINIFIKLIRAISIDTKLVLIGDENQLPSVGAGSLLSSLTEKCKNTFTLQSKQILDQFTNCKLEQSESFDYVIKLQKNYRSQQHINKLAQAVLAGDIDVSNHQNDSIEFLAHKSLDKCLREFAKVYKKLEFAKNYHQALEEFSKFRILMANKNTYLGAQNINSRIELLLGKSPQTIYKAKPIMITQNNYSLGLFNGDIGIIWPDNNSKLKAYFDDKVFSINMLPKFESVYAMTIHKTQGSEFDNVAIILPDEINETLTRKLLYTGITRAKQGLKIISSPNIFSYIVNKSSLRSSNINSLLDNEI